MSHPSPEHPDSAAARQRGFDAIAPMLPLPTAALRDEARKAIGQARARHLATGDWEGVWQASGALDAIREVTR